MLAKGRLALRPLRFALPGTCIPLVFRQQMRARCPVRDLIWMSVLLLCLEALALGIETAAAPLREYDPNSAGYLRRWLTMLALTAPALCLPLAAVLGALSAPAFSRFEETQSLLLTRLSAFDLCAGRLLAWLWPVISTLLASCALWLTIQVIWRPVPPGGAAGYFAIGMMHLVTL